jgi:hypothetical protein
MIMFHKILLKHDDHVEIIFHLNQFYIDLISIVEFELFLNHHEKQRYNQIDDKPIE